MTDKNALRLWGLCLTALTICLLALLVDDQVNSRPLPAENPEQQTQETSTTTTVVDLSFLNTTTTQPVVSAPTNTSSNVETFFECVRWRESRGDYTAVNPTGTFMGAYQFYQGGWDTFAARIGRHDLVGVPPHHAQPADQDAVALAAYNELGSKPWGGACE